MKLFKASLLSLAISMSSYASAALQLDSSLTSEQSTRFKSDMKVLASYGKVTSDWRTKDMLDVSAVTGKNLFNWLSQNTIAVASSTFKPAVCLYYDTKPKEGLDPVLQREAHALMNEMKQGNLAKCKKKLSHVDPLRINDLNIKANFHRLASSFDFSDKLKKLGLEGGLYLTNGRFIPQSSKDHQILIVMDSKDVVISTFSKELSVSLYRSFHYVAEAFNLYSFSECSSQERVFSCDELDDGSLFLLATLLEGAAKTCDACEENDRIQFAISAARYYSIIKGSYNSYSALKKLYTLFPIQRIEFFLNRSKALMSQ